MGNRIPRSDRQRGTLPEIYWDHGDLTYVLESRKDEGAIVIRCAPDGELWVSLGPVPEHHQPRRS